MKNRSIFFSGLIIIISLLLIQATAFSQEKLVDKVEAAIANSFYKDFTVKANKDGDVTIEGEVNTLYDKYEIFNIVSKVPGVETISNQVIVDTPVIPDKIIEDNIRDEKKFVSSILEPDRITIKVNNGIAFLEGTVSFYREKVMMQTLASWQEGVKGIVNNLEVLPPKKAISDANLKKILDQIMKYEFSLEDGVKYTVENNKVILNGTATSLWAKENIAEEFSNVIGIIDVENNLKVEPIL